MTTTSHDEMTIGCKQAAIDTRQQSIQDVEKQSGRMVRPRMPPESRATCREVGARRLAKPTLDLDTFALHLTSFARFLHLQAHLQFPITLLFYFVHRSYVLLLSLSLHTFRA
jgi:hypothetical protein